MRRGHLGQPVGGIGEPGEDLVPLPLGVCALLLQFARCVFPDPRGFCACVVRACVGGRGALVGLLGVLPGPLGLLACLVPVGFGRADIGVGGGADLAGQFPGLSLGASDPGLGGAHCGVRVSLGALDRFGGLRLRVLDACLRVGADPLQFLGVRGGRLGQPVVCFACTGLRGFQVLAHLLGGFVGCGAGLVGDRGASLGVGPLGFRGCGALLGGRAC